MGVAAINGRRTGRLGLKPHLEALPRIVGVSD